MRKLFSILTIAVLLGSCKEKDSDNDTAGNLVGVYQTTTTSGSSSAQHVWMINREGSGRVGITHWIEDRYPIANTTVLDRTFYKLSNVSVSDAKALTINESVKIKGTDVKINTTATVLDNGYIGVNLPKTSNTSEQEYLEFKPDARISDPTTSIAGTYTSSTITGSTTTNHKFVVTRNGDKLNIQYTIEDVVTVSGNEIRATTNYELTAATLGARNSVSINETAGTGTTKATIEASGVYRNIKYSETSNTDVIALVIRYTDIAGVEIRRPDYLELRKQQ